MAKENFWKNLLSALLSKKMLVMLLLGFSSGLPYLLTGGTLKIWLTREQIDISTIGYFSWVGMAYSLKFFWAPFVDRYKLLFFGRRRSWILASQISIAVLLYFISNLDPKVNLSLMAALAVAVAFFSSTQDVAFDAYRREILKDEELGLGSSFSMYGYRISMIISGGVGIGFVGSDMINLTWGGLYVVLSLMMLACVAITCWAPEPSNSIEAPFSLKSAVIDPFKEFLTRENAFIILAFVFLFKFGDALSGAMLNPFYVQMGYSNADIGYIAKTIGLTSALFGLFIGGVVIFKLGLLKSLWFFGILQALSTAGFALITFTGPVNWALALTVIFEDVSAGMGNAAFVAYLASITNKKFTGTQFALLSSVATLGRNFFSGFSGDMVKYLGWAPFFYTCAVIAIPGLIMLWYIQKKQTASSI